MQAQGQQYQNDLKFQRLLFQYEVQQLNQIQADFVDEFDLVNDIKNKSGDFFTDDENESKTTSLELIESILERATCFYDQIESSEILNKDFTEEEYDLEVEREALNDLKEQARSLQESLNELRNWVSHDWQVVEYLRAQLKKLNEGH